MTPEFYPTVESPWTKEQRLAIDWWQRVFHWHPISCPDCRQPLQRSNHVLICPAGHHAQNYAPGLVFETFKIRAGIRAQDARPGPHRSL